MVGSWQLGECVKRHVRTCVLCIYASRKAELTSQRLLVRRIMIFLWGGGSANRIILKLRRYPGLTDGTRGTPLSKGIMKRYQYVVVLYGICLIDSSAALGMCMMGALPKLTQLQTNHMWP